MLIFWLQKTRLWLKQFKIILEKRTFERIPSSWFKRKLKPVCIRVEKRNVMR